MSHSHTHDHGLIGHHHHAPSNFGRAFAVGVVLNGLFVITEVFFGLRAGSIALLADAGHNISDVLGLLLAWWASVLSVKPAKPTHTYGLRSSSILAALTNSTVLLVVVGAIGWEAIRRFWEPAPVQGGLVSAVAGAGILVNGAAALMFLRGSEGDLNIRAAFMHLATDALMALAVLLGGLAIVLTGQPLIDPILSVLIVVVILFGTWGLFKEALGFALHAVPPGLELDQVRTCLAGLEGVEAVHDLHVWGMSTTEVALTAHLLAPGRTDTDELLKEACLALHDRFGIQHATIQIERSEKCAVDCEGDV